MTKTVSPKAIAAAEELAAALQGKIPQDKLDAALAALKAPATTYACKMGNACAIFYQWVSVEITGGKTFRGQGGGICTPPGSGGWGDVYTDDINRLYAATGAFYATSVGPYLNCLFFDSNNNLLGHAECGGVSIGSSIAGSGSWS
jgi:hypothetical protein